jgi:hypothetical protein
MIDKNIKVGSYITSSDTIAFNDYCIVTEIKKGKIIAETQDGKYTTKTINLIKGDAIYWFECTKEGLPIKITQDEFLNRIKQSNSKLKGLFTDVALAVLHDAIYSGYDKTLPKDFNVDTILKNWKQFDDFNEVEEYYKVKTGVPYVDMIEFDGGVLVLINEIKN